MAAHKIHLARGDYLRYMERSGERQIAARLVAERLRKRGDAGASVRGIFFRKDAKKTANNEV